VWVWVCVCVCVCVAGENAKHEAISLTERLKFVVALLLTHSYP
jgi:hypothetical protein